MKTYEVTVIFSVDAESGDVAESMISNALNKATMANGSPFNGLSFETTNWEEV